MYLLRLHGGDNLQIKRYFVSFWNGVDLRYKLLKGPRIRISIAGIIISRVSLITADFMDSPSTQLQSERAKKNRTNFIRPPSAKI